MKRLIAFTATTITFLMCGAFTLSTNDYKPIDTSLLSTTIKPGDDFFEYVNSKWISTNPIPATESRWGVFNLLNEDSRNTIRQILEEDANAKSTQGSIAQKVGDFYASGMDSAAINKAGITPVKSYLQQIDNIKTKDDLLKVLATLHKVGASPMFSLSVDQDPDNSNVMMLTFNQDGLGLPDRDYYFRTDEASKKIRTDYAAYISKMFVLMNAPKTSADKASAVVMNIETNLAGASMTLVQQRDPHSIIHKMKPEDFMAKTPNINWKVYTTAMNIPSLQFWNIAQPDFFVRLNKLMDSVSMDDWKAYLRFHLMGTASRYLSSDYEKATFDFYSTSLQGVSKMNPRWKRVSDLANREMGEALGQEYVKRKFTPEAKQKITDLVNNLKVAFAQRIDHLDWMSDSTKTYAKYKLQKIFVKVGYPDHWRDYSALQIDRGAYVLNIFHCNEFETNRQISKLNKPTDRSEWGMSPQTINAYYNPQNNEIVFPAAILQPPFFDPNADDAVNYGGIGAVIGHEMTHGFDDEGSQFDADGNLKDWWTKADEEKFKAKTSQVSKFYSNYIPIDSIHINGDLTDGENIADQGGLSIAYTAFQIDQQQHPQAAKIDGLTPDQRFFINFAQVWRTQYRDAALRQWVLTNPHSPGKYRVLAVVSNQPAWYTAFNIQPGDKMYIAPQDRLKIW